MSSPSEQNVYVPPCGHDPFMFLCFHDGVPMPVMASVVHTFAPLFHFLCVGIWSDKTNTAKLEGAQVDIFQVNKTMNLDLGLTCFYFLHSSSTSWLSFVLLSCSLSSFLLCKKLKGPRSKLDQRLTLINAFFRWTRPQTLTGHLVVLLPFVLFLCARSLNLLGYLMVMFSLCIFFCEGSWNNEPFGAPKVKELTLPSHPSISSEKTLMYPLVVLFRTLCVKAMHYEFCDKVLHIEVMHFRALYQSSMLWSSTF